MEGKMSFFKKLLIACIILAVIAFIAFVIYINYFPQQYEVYTIDDLYAFSEKTFDYDEIILKRDLDFEDYDFETLDLNGVETFNGNGHSIKNIKVDAYDDFKGLFQRVSNVSNLKIKDITIDAYADFKGLFQIQRCSDVKIENIELNSYHKGSSISLFWCNYFDNVHISGEIFAPNSTYIGGFLAATNISYLAEFKNCSSNLKIEGGDYVAGFLVFDGKTGSNPSSLKFENCTSNCEISATKCAGGFVATTKNDDSYDAVFENCVNEGNISAPSAGGIVAELYRGTIENCTNNGKITGAYNVGGIVGLQNCAVSDCVNNGEVVSLAPREDVFANLGGISGMQNSGDIINCTNNADITTPYSVVGGIVGESRGNLIECVNNAKINGNVSVGGIVGMATKEIKVNLCENKGDVYGKSLVGGIMGSAGAKKSSGFFSNIFNEIFSGKKMTIEIMYCTSSGNIYADSYVDGIVGKLYSCEISKDLLDTNTVTGKTGKPNDNTWDTDGTSVGPPVKLPNN